jgi:hypothetical protein
MTKGTTFKVTKFARWGTSLSAGALLVSALIALAPAADATTMSPAQGPAALAQPIRAAAQPVQAARAGSGAIDRPAHAAVSALASHLSAGTTRPNASGGGCINYTIYNEPTTIGVCISWQSYTTNIIADSYYNGSPPAGCTYDTAIYDGYGDLVAYNSFGSCASGRNWGGAVRELTGQFYQQTCYYDYGQQLGCGVSPWQYL